MSCRRTIMSNDILVLQGWALTLHAAMHGPYVEQFELTFDSSMCAFVWCVSIA